MYISTETNQALDAAQKILIGIPSTKNRVVLGHIVQALQSLLDDNAPVITCGSTVEPSCCSERDARELRQFHDAKTVFPEPGKEQECLESLSTQLSITQQALDDFQSANADFQIEVLHLEAQLSASRRLANERKDMLKEYHAKLNEYGQEILRLNLELEEANTKLKIQIAVHGDKSHIRPQSPRTSGPCGPHNDKLGI